ncbi:hypothetical protein ACFVYR_28925 [Streptomyces sp. NPDC058284]|uniref:hypothetical protein n=1 Tax=unclassified Streptomyces TaxID=2593676 RepID=UPI00364D3E91
MTSARRLIAAVSLAAGAAALATPSAQAAAPPSPDAGKISPVAVLDDVTKIGIPEERRAELPTLASQLSGLNQLKKLEQLNELHQITDLVAPVTGLVPGIQ